MEYVNAIRLAFVPLSFCRRRRRLHASSILDAVVVDVDDDDANTVAAAR